MDCREFHLRFEEAVAGPGDSAFAEHAGGCPRCAAELRRARAMARALAGFPRLTPAEDLDRRVLDGARKPAPVHRLLLKAAAAALLIASGGLAALLGLSPERPGLIRGFRVVIERDLGSDPGDIALEEIYGPALVVASGGGEENGDRKR